MAHLARTGLAPASIKTYLAGVQHAQVMRGLPEPSQQGSMPRLQLMKKGVVKLRAEAGIPPVCSRLPITIPVLHQLHQVWARTPESNDGVVLWAAAALCFFGFFRSGEVTVPSLTAFDQRWHLAWGDVSVDSVSDPAVLKVHLKRSKCDQLGQGVDVFVGRTGDNLCPVSAVMRYVAWRGLSSGCFFLLGDRSPLTKARSVARVKQALNEAGVSAEGYSGHSFRIGAATVAAEAGIADSVIQMLGRWNSNAFQSYIRTPRDRLAQYSRVLSTQQVV